MADSTDEPLVETITLTSNVPEIERQISSAKQATADLAEEEKRLAAALADPRFRDAAVALERQQRATRDLVGFGRQRTQLAARRQDLDDGVHLSRVERAARLEAEAARVATRERRDQLAAQRSLVASGVTLTAARDAVRLKHDEARTGAMIARQELQARRESVASGATARQAADQARLRVEREQVERVEARIYSGPRKLDHE